MPARPVRWTDQHIEALISLLLRAGVSSAAVVVFIGGMLYLHQYGALPANYRRFHGEPPQLHTLTGIVHGALALDSRAIIQFGLLLLILTPIARVLFSVIAFELQRDRFYTLVTCVVLAVLLINLFWG